MEMFLSSLSFLGVLALMIFGYSLFYLVLVLLVLAGTAVSILMYFNCLSLLLGMILLIIYFGAMMIMIGYTCAISPDSYKPIKMLIIIFGPVYLILNQLSSVVFAPNFKSAMSDNAFNFLFTTWGFKIFFALIVMMLLLLVLMNATQKISKGSLRL